jgi:hypothetical protein
MHKRPKPHVVRQIPSDVVGVLVDDDAVAVPEPVVAIVIIVWRNVEEVAVEPEAVSASAGYHENMARPKAAVVMPVLPGMVEVVVLVIAPVAVADPSAVVAVDVGRVGMSLAVAKATLVAVAMLMAVAMLVTVVTIPMAIWSVMWNILVVPIAVTVVIAIPVMIVLILRHRVNAKGKDYDKKSCEFLQGKASSRNCNRLTFWKLFATIAQEIAGLPSSPSSEGIRPTASPRRGELSALVLDGWSDPVKPEPLTAFTGGSITPSVTPALAIMKKAAKRGRFSLKTILVKVISVWW